LIKYSTNIIVLLKDILKQKNTLKEYEFYILADTSYGSCCVDEVAAQHVNADCIIHFGNACITKSIESIPVYYCLGNSSLDLSLLKDNITGKYENQNIILFYELSYHHLSSEIVNVMKSIENINIIVPSIRDDLNSTTDVKSKQQSESKNYYTIGGFHLSIDSEKSLSDYNLIFIGNNDDLYLRNIMLRLNTCKSFIIYNPNTMTFDQPSLNTRRILGRRYYLIEKAKTANIVGILMGTLAIHQHLEMVQHIKKLLKSNEIKSQMFVVGKINEPKISNFSEIDIFVIIACSFNSLVDTRDYYHDIITPYELDMALNERRNWDGNYSIDFQDILPNGPLYIKNDDDDDNNDNADEPFYSPVTGKLMSKPSQRNKIENNDKKLDTNETSKSTAIIKTQQNGKLIVSGDVDNIYTRFQKRTFQGLDYTANVQSTEIKDGLHGIASEYTTEGHGNSNNNESNCNE
jgi:diphthamide biosynthesis protein 2